MTSLHGWIGYALIVGAFVGAIWDLYNAMSREVFSEQSEEILNLFLVVMVVEALLGLLLILLRPEALARRPLHPVITVGAVALFFVGRQPQGDTARAKHLIQAAVYTAAGVLLIVSVSGI